MLLLLLFNVVVLKVFENDKNGMLKVNPNFV